MTDDHSSIQDALELPPSTPNAGMLSSPLPSTPIPPTIKPKSAAAGGGILSGLSDKPEEKSPVTAAAFARSSSPLGGGSSLRSVFLGYMLKIDICAILSPSTFTTDFIMLVFPTKSSTTFGSLWLSPLA